jgi:D-alanine-D-alanine ligase
MSGGIKRFAMGRIAVFMGGPSTEREVSLESGKAVYTALKGRGCDVVGIDLTEGSEKEVIEAINKNRISVIFLALHGRFGEDGTIQSMLRKLKVPFTGSCEAASRLAMDKIASRKKFQGKKLTVPKHLNLNKHNGHDLKEITAYFGSFPLVVKPNSHGSSIGITLVEDEAGLKKGLDIAFGYDDNIIVEEFIEGRELTVGILEENFLPVVEVIPKLGFFDFQAKYSSPHTQYIVPAKLEEKISRRVQEAGLAAHQALGCYGCSRVDIILDRQNRPVVLEVNTIPGFTSHSLLPKAAAASNISFSELCLRLVRLAYEKK